MEKNIPGNDDASRGYAATTKKSSELVIGRSMALAVLLLALGVLLVERHRSADADPAAFLSADTLVYIDQHQAEKRSQRFWASPLGQTITSIDLPALVHDLGAPENIQTDVQKKLGDIKGFLNSKIVTELFGDRFVVAVLPKRDWMKGPGGAPDPSKYLVLLCQPQHGAAAMGILTSFYGGDSRVESVPYGEYSLKRFKNDKVSFVACAVKGWLVAAFEERALRETLDTFDAGANSLAGSERFKKIVASLPPESEQIVYMNLDGLAKLAKGDVRPNQAALAKQLDEVLAGLDSIAYGSWLRNGILQERMLVSFIPDKVAAPMKKLLATPAKQDEFLPHLRDNLVLYTYSGVNDWPGMLDGLAPERRAKIEAFSGHSLQEWQQMLGYAPSRLFLRKEEGAQTLPLPLVNFCVTAAEPVKLNDTVSALLAQAGIEMTKGKFQDASYQVWSKAPEKNLRLYSALWRGQWCVGNSLDFFKEIAEPSPADQSLLAAKDFTTVENGIKRPVESLTYIRIDQALDLLHDGCGWLATLMAVKDRELSAKAKLVNERLIFPLLSGAKMYQRSLSRAVVENNMLKVDARTSIGPVEKK